MTKQLERRNQKFENQETQHYGNVCCWQKTDTVKTVEAKEVALGKQCRTNIVCLSLITQSHYVHRQCRYWLKLTSSITTAPMSLSLSLSLSLYNLSFPKTTIVFYPVCNSTPRYVHLPTINLPYQHSVSVPGKHPTTPTRNQFSRPKKINSKLLLEFFQLCYNNTTEKCHQE